MDIRSLISKLENIESMNRIAEADDPAAVIQKYTDMGKKPTPDMPAFIDPKDGKVKYIEKGPYGQTSARVMPSDWIKRYAPDLADALAAQGGNKAAYGNQEKGGLFGIKGLGNFDQGTKVNTAQAGADQLGVKFKADKLKQLNDLIAKLNAEVKGGNQDPTVGKVDYSLAGGTPGGGVGLKLKESLLAEFGIEEDVPTPPPGGAAPAGGDTVSQLKAVMAQLVDMGDDPEVAKALQSAQAAIDAAEKAKQAKPAAQTAPGTTTPATSPETKPETKPAADGGAKGSKPVGPTATTQEKMDRFVFLMKKKKEAAQAPTMSDRASDPHVAGVATAAPAATPAAAPPPQQPTIEESYFINKIRLIESKIISEALTPEEEKELQSISKEVIDASKTGADIPPEVLAAVKEFQAGAGGQATSPEANPATKPAAKSQYFDPKVQAFQQELIKKGAKIKADGVYGPATNQAAMQFGMAPPQGIKHMPGAGGGASPGSTGAPPAGGTKKTGPQGQPLVQGPGGMGYYNNPAVKKGWNLVEPAKKEEIERLRNLAGL